MEHRLLGRTGVRVSPLCLGAMMLGPWGVTVNPAGNSYGDHELKPEQRRRV